MPGLRDVASRPVRHEVLWPALTAVLALVLVVGLGVTTVAAPPTGASAVDLAFGLGPVLVWAAASVAIGRFVRGGLMRQGLTLSPASSLLIAGGLAVSGAFCVMPYEFMLVDVAGLGFDVVLPLWLLGVLLLIGAVAAHFLARGVDVETDEPTG